MDEKRQVYEPPAVIYSEPLECIAGACEASNPINGKDSGACTVLMS